MTVQTNQPYYPRDDDQNEEINVKQQFTVEGGSKNGPFVWNSTTAYIDSWNQLPLHSVRWFLNTQDFQERKLTQLLKTLLSNLKRMKYDSPEPVQQFALKPIVVGDCDAKVISLTGSGKTLVFALPIVNKLLKSGLTGKMNYFWRSFLVSFKREIQYLDIHLGRPYKRINFEEF